METAAGLLSAIIKNLRSEYLCEYLCEYLFKVRYLNATQSGHHGEWQDEDHFSHNGQRKKHLNLKTLKIMSYRMTHTAAEEYGNKKIERLRLRGKAMHDRLQST